MNMCLDHRQAQAANTKQQLIMCTQARLARERERVKKDLMVCKRHTKWTNTEQPDEDMDMYE